MIATNRNISDYLNDLLESCSDIAKFIENSNFAEFEKDKKTVNAVLKSLEIIGEAARKIPDSVRNKHPEIKWKQITGMRDRLVHDYTGVDLEIVWKTVTEDIPKLKNRIEKIV